MTTRGMAIAGYYKRPVAEVQMIILGLINKAKLLFVGTQFEAARMEYVSPQL